jgi:hypothetical protein
LDASVVQVIELKGKKWTELDFFGRYNGGLRLRHYIVLAANPGRSRSSGVLFFGKHPFTAAPSACHLHRGRGSDAHHPPKRRRLLPPTKRHQATYRQPCQLRCRARPRVPARPKLLRKISRGRPPRRANSCPGVVPSDEQRRRYRSLSACGVAVAERTKRTDMAFAH